MPWFTQDAIEFFRELELNNHKEWFEANKKRYETNVKKPMEAFADHMIGRMREILPNIETTGKKAVFRIYKDVRFSKDKTPYKTNAGMQINSGGKGDLGTPGLYFHIDPRVMGIASGCYQLEPPDLKKMREYLGANPEEFRKQLDDKEFQKFFGGIKGEVNKILPPDLKEAAAKQPLIFNKQFYYWAEHEPEQALREDLDEFLMAHMLACRKMNEFLVKGLN
ncbi:MAG: DUF2461 domain-containing protein [Chlorobia bacterium]|nr:DUF2461 domain-containing protein [Fimbriimonadaceae bacterium]